MILLDAYALLALARDEPAADEVEAIIRAGDAAISSVNLLEVLDGLLRRYGWSPAETSARVGLLIGERLRVVPADAEIAWRGALLRARYYDRSACALSLADCVLLASARRDDAVVSSDPALAAVARKEGIDFVALPDSSGRRPWAKGSRQSAGRRAGNRTTSRIVSRPLRSIVSRSMPSPRPPVGGMP